MTPEERRVIEELFGKLAKVAQSSGPREREADALIQQLTAHQPGAAYYMAQAIVAQERALTAAQAQIQELEERAHAPQSSGGFLSGLFGVPSSGTPTRETGFQGSRPSSASSGPWGSSATQGQRRGLGGGGFLAGAAQTAVGVAGGVVLGSFLADMLAPDAAMAAEVGGEALASGTEAPEDHGSPEEAPEAPNGGDLGDDFGSDF